MLTLLALLPGAFNVLCACPLPLPWVQHRLKGAVLLQPKDALCQHLLDGLDLAGLLAELAAHSVYLLRHALKLRQLCLLILLPLVVVLLLLFELRLASAPLAADLIE